MRLDYVTERSYSAPPEPTTSRALRRTASQTLEQQADDMNDLMGMFRLFDASQKGYIEASQIRQVLSALSNKSTQDEMIGAEELGQLLRDAHLEQDRKIHFQG